MTPLSTGDLATHFSTRLHMSRVKTEVDTLSNELASGLREDIAAQQGADFSRISALERSIEITDRYSAANADTTLWLDTAQTSLDAVQRTVSQSAAQFMTAATEGSLSNLESASTSAERALSSVMSKLNTTVGGAAIFGGTETGSSPLADSETMLTVLSSALAGATTTNDALAAIDAWFADPVAGFSAAIYRGGASDAVQLLSSEETTLSFNIRANDPALIDTIKALATAAMATEPVFAGDAAAQTEMIRSASEQLFTSEARLATLRGGLGALQAQAEADSVLLLSMRSGYEMAMSDIYAADPYETASSLDAATLQLEMIYSITARISDLTLARYL
ncbi:MAG: hypothetical protein AAGA38_06620 [Pseudomonadota bacterium]